MSEMKFLVFESYISLIKNSIGSKIFKNYFFEVDGQKKDILEDGNLSCAFFVSNVLKIFDLIGSGHANVVSTIKDLENFGWEKIEELKVGAILHWEAVDFGKTGMHEHIGFYIGENTAISNNSTLGYPTEHHYTFENPRKILGIYWNKKLD